MSETPATDRKTIFIVDDDFSTVTVMSALFEEQFNVLSAANLEEADNYLTRLQEIDLIVMDGHVEPGDTLDLIAQIRSLGYTKPILASSNNPDMRNKQIAAGCSHDVGSLKANATKIIYELLLPQQQEVL